MSLVIYRPANRYFIIFSYIGTRYRGVQRQVSKHSRELDNTIQSTLEMAINSSLEPRPWNHPVSSIVSSRTDRMVHASENVMATDLYHPVAGMTYDQDYVCDSMNKWLYENNHLILVKKIVQVPRRYYLRRQVGEREYIMRVLYHPGVADFNKLTFDLASRHDLNQVSVAQVPYNSSKLSIENVRRTIDYMKGTHDFRSFEAPSFRRTERNSIKTITKFTVTQVDPDTGSRIDSVTDSKGILLDFVVRSGSFLYQQVRRMVGLSLTVGLGHATLDDVKFLLDNPCRDNWDYKRFHTAMPSGLYLRKIKYPGLT